jgi:hypothetical protein
MCLFGVTVVLYFVKYLVVPIISNCCTIGQSLLTVRTGGMSMYYGLVFLCFQPSTTQVRSTFAICILTFFDAIWLNSQFDWSIAVQDQAILHEELKCLRGIFTWDVARLSESVKIHSPAARVFLRFPKVSRHPSCMDHAILHGKPFGIPLIQSV